NSHEIITGAFTRDSDFAIPGGRLQLALQARVKDGLQLFDATELSRVLMGDSIYSNMMVFGAAWQRGLIPVSLAAIKEAIEMNGAAVEQNRRAFAIGRWAAAFPGDAAAVLAPAEAEAPRTLDDRIDYRAAHLVDYQGPRLARRYRKLVDGIADERVREAVAKGYHKVLSYKDEYEVARLLIQSRDKAREEFSGDFRMSFHLAPPILGGKGADGRPKKRRFGQWLERPLRAMARMKGLRGTPLDIFGYSAERRLERRLIRQYEADMAEVLPRLDDATRDAIVALAELPLSIRGFGPVKEANADKAAKRREELLATVRAGGEDARRAAE
ncbi:MAG: indolepyruvate ferredoxin oxidoreductase family protein, partial [Roseovarius sp.]|nr:indolepyruvate ferredoxin oxidoreductase family protein [Roseovarius sp.]